MRAIDRRFQPISLTPSVTGDWVELRIHDDCGPKDRVTLLSASEARLLAYRLLAEVEVLGPDREAKVSSCEATLGKNRASRE